MKLILSISLLLIAKCAFSQTLKPEFSFTLYAEDAKGNKDSVTIGYHPDARQDEVLDTRFADKDISDQPFDSVLEIRAHKIFWLWTKGVINPPFLNRGMSKHLTLTHNSEKCFDPFQFDFGRNMGFILVKIKYPPLKLSWDKNLFEKIFNPCISQSFLFYSDYPMYFMFTHELLKKVTYLKELSEIPESLLIPVKFKNNLGMIDSLETNYVISFQKANLTVSTTDLNDISTINMYPNPCTQFIHLSLSGPQEKILTLNIFTQGGASIDLPFIQSDDLIKVQTENLPQGQYFINIKTSAGRVFSDRFYKVN